ncbi:acetate uptake transporter [Tamlana sp. 2_MG-2023]|uniref:acetate uptake transporter n=1 Tax=unclassified Tamlana TaxID=2614803 RepID=UPI0026E1881C|nr:MULTISPECIES: acetate uptake transporter [unclassified Tamlana]MDO6761344.1 acetate uptake transporter [Tamlana sp. 2_MG-2023]MDO6792042.1 acetate uptake transporter [Tamlana sp. 1_MG-2023]
MENNTTQLVDNTANPAPLGLLGFGMTTVLLNLHNAGLFELDSIILGMGIFYGGMAQVIAGIMEWKKGNTFATTAFTSYGFFWLSFAALVMLPKTGLTSAPENTSLVSYLVMWGIFTGALFIGTFKISRALQFVFGSLTLLFFLLALGDYTHSVSIGHFAGYVGIFCGFSAIYTGVAQVINELYKKVILPIGPVN